MIVSNCCWVPRQLTNFNFNSDNNIRIKSMQKFEVAWKTHVAAWIVVLYTNNTSFHIMFKKKMHGVGGGGQNVKIINFDRTQVFTRSQ